ncbi:hypothetical protein BD410DRAFT_792051 [Rickenella mellea]|uniref:Uncharacterized protein n=1 Tax=Rickenella mellea TaxID=50990 RepID=A0A4Y7PVM2_9AGAM|nr:hypothetical protein BD410DRAFT_792051 [Rickenella mellea]
MWSQRNGNDVLDTSDCTTDVQKPLFEGLHILLIRIITAMPMQHRSRTIHSNKQT